MDEQFCETRFTTPSSFVWKIEEYETLCKPKILSFSRNFQSDYFRITGIDAPFYLEIMFSNLDPTVVRFNSSKREEDAYMDFKLFICAWGQKVLQHEQTGYFNNPKMEIDEFETLQKTNLLPDDTLTLCLVVRVFETTKTAIAAISNRQLDLRESSKKNSLVLAFAKLLQDKNDTDIVLRVKEKEIAAHKLVLNCRSSVFHELTDNVTKLIITDVRFDVFSAMIRFMYTDEVDCRDVPFSLALLDAANKYDVPLLRSHCVDYLEVNISEKNIFEILQVAAQYGNMELKKICRNFMKHMSAVSCLTELALRKMLGPDISSAVEFLNNEEAEQLPEEK